MISNSAIATKCKHLIEDEFKPFFEFLNKIHPLMVREVKAGRCNGKVIRWRIK